MSTPLPNPINIPSTATGPATDPATDPAAPAAPLWARATLWLAANWLFLGVSCLLFGAAVAAGVVYRAGGRETQQIRAAYEAADLPPLEYAGGLWNRSTARAAGWFQDNEIELRRTVLTGRYFMVIRKGDHVFRWSDPNGAAIEIVQK